MTLSLPVIEAGGHGVPVTEYTFCWTVVFRSFVLVLKAKIPFSRMAFAGRMWEEAADTATKGIGVRFGPYRHEWPGPWAAGMAAVEPTGRYSRRVPTARAGTAQTPCVADYGCLYRRVSAIGPASGLLLRTRNGRVSLLRGRERRLCPTEGICHNPKPSGKRRFDAGGSSRDGKRKQDAST